MCIRDRVSTQSTWDAYCSVQNSPRIPSIAFNLEGVVEQDKPNNVLANNHNTTNMGTLNNINYCCENASESIQDQSFLISPKVCANDFQIGKQNNEKDVDRSNTPHTSEKDVQDNKAKNPTKENMNMNMNLNLNLTEKQDTKGKIEEEVNIDEKDKKQFYKKPIIIKDDIPLKQNKAKQKITAEGNDEENMISVSPLYRIQKLTQIYQNNKLVKVNKTEEQKNLKRELKQKMIDVWKMDKRGNIRMVQKNLKKKQLNIFTQPISERYQKVREELLMFLNLCDRLKLMPSD
eukprot:TRINITY_DN7760_c0_g1_i2.p1 TRINITY_DN7760_c0_g1~~TRINITY_DN7760_c0_g1_i2.p1  ORF type:complete len:290 (+),score=75.99 TRINITY_DN7760_c0_g1_i2:163-1032(+)